MEELGASFWIVAFIIAVCALMDVFLSKEDEEKIRFLFLRGFYFLEAATVSEKLRQSANAILDIFDVVYGPKQWTLKCLGRTILVSSIIILSLSLIFLQRYQQFVSSINPLDLSHNGNFYVGTTALVFMVISLPINTFIDYLCLWKSRKILSFGRRAKPIGQFLLLFTDIFFSYSIYSMTFVLFTLYAVKSHFNIFLPSWSFKHKVMQAVFIAFCLPWFGFGELLGISRNYPPILGISFLSTLSTSAIFATYSLMALVGSSSRIFRSRVMIAFDRLIESKAMFTTIGSVVSAIIVLGKCAVYLLEKIC